MHLKDLHCCSVSMAKSKDTPFSLQGLVIDLSLVLLLISNLPNGLRLHQFLVTKSAEANKSVKTDANGAH